MVDPLEDSLAILECTIIFGIKEHHLALLPAATTREGSPVSRLAQHHPAVPLDGLTAGQLQIEKKNVGC